MGTDTDAESLRARCEAVLRASWREGSHDGVAFGFTCPSPTRYPWQWYWDSCFAALVWRRFDRARSRRELGSLLAAQRDDGFIGHTIFWGRPLTGWRRLTYNVLARDALTTASIQPPALAWVWAQAVGDPAAEPRISAHHRWLETHRDLDGDGLVWIVQPDESGLDASPQFDAIWGARSHGRAGFPWLVRRNRRLGYDLARIDRAGGPVCCEVLTNVIYSLSRTALGLPSLTDVLVKRLYDPARGLFVPLGRAGGTPIRRPVAATIAALTPLALPDLPEEIGHRLAAHLLDRREFHSPVAPPSVSLAETAFSLRDTSLLGQRRYWRGPTWINTAWLCWRGLHRLGYVDRARELAEGLAGAVAASGLREYYHPWTGAGMGARDFAWSALILEMLDDLPDATGRARAPA